MGMLRIMPDYRSYCEELAELSGEVELNAFESHHLVKVNRARRGSMVRLFDGKGCEGDAELLEPSTRGARLLLGEKTYFPQPQRKIVVIQAIPKSKTFEQEIRRLTELGVWKIVPLRTAHTEFSLAEERSQGREGRWLAAAIEGAKQSGNPWLPQIAPVCEWGQWIAGAASLQGERIIASLAEGSRSPAQILGTNSEVLPETEYCHLLIGPEGDFTLEETAQALHAGFQPVTLGPHVLRVETAALALVVLAARW